MNKKFLLVVIILILSAEVYTASSENPDYFTTNINLKDKIIADSYTNVDIETLSFLENLLDRGRKWLSQSFNVWRFYQNLANPSARYIVLRSGLRKEEVATVLSRELKWTPGERYAFLTSDERLSKKNMEGYYNPGGYLMPASQKPEGAYRAILERFDQEIATRYASSTTKIINIDLAMKIASIIEREAAGKNDMRLISGVIWNRIFKDMNLEMDATLQYAKGNSRNGWWPKVRSEDKYIESPYNTYKNKGLPPTPISNVSVAAIKAALNPQKTNCIFYLHDKRGRIHCGVTYKDHQKNIERYYR